ncbi:transcriptional regulator, MerR family [Bifidobacterium pseudolongum subsp. globosum]|nr:transcriptional regulator, MerR family [Bifidobacterium pseudolongum subsp. globosum]
MNAPLTRRHGAPAHLGDEDSPKYVDVPLIDVDDVMVQGELFPLRDLHEPLFGYRGTVASRVAGITYRQLDYWARKRIVVPSIAPSTGSGSRRLYAFRDVVILAVSKKLLDIGVNLQNVTNAVEYLMRQPSDRLEHMTILCDGQQVEECVEGEQMARMLSRGEAVFGVSVGALWHRIQDALATEEHVEVTDAAVIDRSLPVNRLAAKRLRETLDKRRVQREAILSATDSGAVSPTLADVDQTAADQPILSQGALS